MHTINVNLNISTEFLRDIFVTCLESGSAWAGFTKRHLVKPDHNNACTWYYQSAVISDYGDENKAQSSKELTPESLLEGIKIVLNRSFNIPESHGHCHISYTALLHTAVLQDDAGAVDSELADLIMQCSYFGHVVYG